MSYFLIAFLSATIARWSQRNYLFKIIQLDKSNELPRADSDPYR
jgi:hypothetical protein